MQLRHFNVKSVVTSAFTRTWTLMASQSSSVGFEIELAFAAITLLGRLSTRFRSVSMEMFDHSSRRAFVRHWCGWEGFTYSLIPKVFNRIVLSGWGQDAVQASQVPPPQNRLSVSLWSLLCARVHSHVGTWRGHPQTVPTKLGAWNCTEMSWYADALRVPLTGTSCAT